MHIKNSVQASNNQLQQLVKRITEQNKNIKLPLSSCTTDYIREHEPTVIPGFDFYYKKVKLLNNITIESKHPDCYYMLDDDTIVAVKAIYSRYNNKNEFFASVQKYTKGTTFYNDEIDSRILGFFVTKMELPENITTIPLNRVIRKCIHVTLENEDILSISIL